MDASLDELMLLFQHMTEEQRREVMEYAEALLQRECDTDTEA